MGQSHLQVTFCVTKGVGGWSGAWGLHMAPGLGEVLISENFVARLTWLLALARVVAVLGPSRSRRRIDRPVLVRMQQGGCG